MHPITLPMAELKPALTGLGKIIPAKSTLAIVQHLKVERTAEGWVTLTATDLDRFVTVRLEQPDPGPAISFLAPYAGLVTLCKHYGRDEKIEVFPGDKKQTLRVRFSLAGQAGESNLPTVPVEEYPVTPKVDGESFVLPPEVRQSIRQALECSSSDTTRYVLNGAYVDASQPRAHYIVATDGRHLFSANSFALPLKNSALIPNHKFLGWREFHQDGEWKMRADEKYIQVSSRRWRLISRQIEGKYPDWRVVVPNPADARTHLVFDPESLFKVVQRLPNHDERHHTLGLEWREGRLSLLAKDQPSSPWLKIPVADVQGQGPDVTTFLDRRYLMKALDFGLNHLGLMDELTPLRFYREGKQIIIMPVRGEGDPKTIPNPPPAIPQPKPQIKTPPPMNTPQPPQESNPGALDEALEMTAQLRDLFQDSLEKVRHLGLRLKALQREQKSSAREFASVRATLRSLQGLKL